MYKIIGSDGKQYGPVDAEQIHRWVAEGRANAATRVQAEGSSEWKTLSEFPELSGTLATPVLPPVAPPAISRSAIKESVNGPAIGLIVTAIIGMALQALSLLFYLLGFSQGFRGAGPDAAINYLTSSFGILFSIIAVVIGILILFGALKMRNLESRSWAMAASILALVPCVSPCCLVGLPIGIWSLVILADPNVKSAFQTGESEHG